MDKSTFGESNEIPEFVGGDYVMIASGNHDYPK